MVHLLLKLHILKTHEDSIAERLINLEERTGGILKWSDSSGIRQVVISRVNEQVIEKLKKDLIIMAYGDL